MTAWKGPPISELRNEARNLEYLLRDYLDDRAFITRNPRGTILYFVDAHEIKSYIDPDNHANMTGFVLHAEQALSFSAADAFQLTLKNDLVLRELLFEQDSQVGLLPSHGEEVDEEIAYRQFKWASEKISLIDRARSELRRLRSDPKTRRLLAVASNSRDDPAEKRNLVDFFRRTAPELISLLRPNPDNPIQRIEALIDKSQLVRLVDINWEQFGFGVDASSRLRAVRPKPEDVKYWSGHLSRLKERRRNSNRANRIDGEALAYLQALNQELSTLQNPRVTARLVTRAMTLIKAGRKAEPKINFLRHPRLMALNNWPDAGIVEDQNVARTLMIALRTYRAQLKIEDSSLDRADEVRLSHAIEMLLQAWQQFERSGLTNELRATAPIKANNSDSVEAEFSALIDWFRSDSDMLKVMQTDLLRAIGHFGEATFALARSGTESPIQARIYEYGHPTRARVLPMVAGAPGPIDFFSPQLRGLQRVSDLEEAMGKLDSDTAERYVAWSLLFACQGRWDLAAVYADSAIAVARLQHTNEAANIADEARLLRAQIQRLGGGTERERSKSDELLRRYERTGRMLTEIALPRDPRVPREQAAQLLELCLSVDQANGDLPSLAKGIDLLHQALDWARRDDLLRSRILELGLNYHLAVRDRPGLWPERTDADEIVASRWHLELHSILEHQRQHLMMDEISRRARAMEIIGFQLVPQKPSADDDEVLARWAAGATSEKPLRVPLNLRLDVGDLRDQLKRSNDQTAAMIQVELESILRRLYHRRPRDLIYAPIWAAYDVARIISLINDQDLRNLAGEAYILLKKVAGASQHAGIQPDDRAPLQEAAAQFARIAGLLQTQSSGRSLDATNALFYLRMENCYARLLLSRIGREEERQKLLSELESDYRVIASDYPAASIPHFRLNVILSEMKRREDAFDELNKALRLVEQDPFLQTPSHWVRSTMERRLAGQLSREAEKTLDQLKEYPDDQQRDCVLTDLLNAFKILYDGWRTPESPEVDYLRQLEARRRINNIVYIASLIFTVDPRGAGLLKLGFDRHKMLSLLERLHGGRIDEITELNVVHTVGYASAILGDIPNSVRAGHQLMKLLIETGGSPREDPNVARILTDALAWFASAQDGLSFEVSITGNENNSGYYTSAQDAELTS